MQQKDLRHLVPSFLWCGMSRAIGKDGRWHDWADLTDDERREWMEAMTDADRYVEARKSRTDNRQKSPPKSMIIYNNQRRIIN